MLMGKENTFYCFSYSGFELISFVFEHLGRYELILKISLFHLLELFFHSLKELEFKFKDLKRIYQTEVDLPR